MPVARWETLAGRLPHTTEHDVGKGRCAPNFMQPKVVPIDRPEEA